MRIFDLLNAYTSEAGSWSIEYNDHKITYCTPAEHYIAPEDDGEELDGIDTKQDIYRLYWFNNTPVGHYCILANSIEELEEKIINVIQDENLTKYHNKEKIIADKEQIIIDGVDVGGCKYYNKNIKMDCLLYPLQPDACCKNPNCYFKQIERKTQECENLKEKLDKDIKKNNTLIDKLDHYCTAITKIKDLAEFSYRPYIACGEYNETCIVLTNILNVIEEIKGKND